MRMEQSHFYGIFAREWDIEPLLDPSINRAAIMEDRERLEDTRSGAWFLNWVLIPLESGA